MIDSFDCVVPFHLEKSNIRGRIVRLDNIIQDITHHHHYPALINYHLTQAITLSLAIASCFKFEGLFTLQITGSHIIKLLVVDINKEGHVRACARYDEEHLKTLSSEDYINNLQIFGEGYFAFTIEPENDENRYQGIVELTGTSLAEAAHHFFRQSEQLETGVMLASSLSGAAESTVAGGAIMIQRLPLPSHISTEEKERLDDEWIHAMSLVGSLSKKELLNRQLTNEDLLYRLFWENGVRVHEPIAYSSQCRCSEEKIFSMLRTFKAEEIKEMVLNDKIEVTCEFCGRQYNFKEEEVLQHP